MSSSGADGDALEQLDIHVHRNIFAEIVKNKLIFQSSGCRRKLISMLNYSVNSGSTKRHVHDNRNERAERSVLSGLRIISFNMKS